MSTSSGESSLFGSMDKRSIELAVQVAIRQIPEGTWRSLLGQAAFSSLQVGHFCGMLTAKVVAEILVSRMNPSEERLDEMIRETVERYLANSQRAAAGIGAAVCGYGSWLLVRKWLARVTPVGAPAPASPLPTSEPQCGNPTSFTTWVPVVLGAATGAVSSYCSMGVQLPKELTFQLKAKIRTQLELQYKQRSTPLNPPASDSNPMLVS